MIFKPMKREEVLKLLEGQEDVLTPAIRAHEEYFKKLLCPYCSGDRCMPFVDPRRPFREGDLLPNYLARCTTCGTEFEPYTKLQISLPHPEKVSF
jgi:DNA-directed RNA polymerase subunit RPC12/RpoP